MSELKEIFFRKTKKGYECYDRQGNVAIGITKEQARSKYFLYYNIEETQNKIDMNAYMNQFLNND